MPHATYIEVSLSDPHINHENRLLSEIMTCMWTFIPPWFPRSVYVLKCIT